MLIKQRHYSYGAAVLFGCLLLPFLYAAFFTFPEGDDFKAALDASCHFDIIGAIDHMFSAWWKWSGRYTFSFLWIFFGDIAESRTAYTISILFSFFLAWISIFGIIREIGRQDAAGQPVFIATFWLFAVLCTHGTVYQWYLLVEILTLIAGYSFLLLYIWSLCRLWNRQVVTHGTKIFCIAGCIIAAGLYENTGPMVLLISCVAYLLARLYNHPHRATYFLLVKIAAVCFLVSYLARGNFRRQTKRGMDFALMYTQVMHAGKDWWTYVVPALINPIYLAAIFVAAWVKPRWSVSLDQKMPAPLILAGSTILLCGYTFMLTLVHAMSDVTVGEATKIPANIAQYCIIFALFALFSCRDWLHLDALRRLGKPLNLVIILAILVTGNSNFFPVLWNGLLGEIVRHEQAYEKRKAVMAEHQGKTVAVMPLLHAPKPIPQETIGNKASSWPNKYAAPLYGVKGLETALPSPESAFALAVEHGLLAWREAGNGCSMAYVASLPLQSNATYTFDWIFLKTQGTMLPHVRTVVLPEDSFLARLPASWGIPDLIMKDIWPFKDLFQRPQATEFQFAGDKYYTIPLPQSDSAATRVGKDTIISVNNGPSMYATGTGTLPSSRR